LHLLFGSDLKYRILKSYIFGYSIHCQLTDTIENIIEGCRRKKPQAQRMLYEMLSSRMYGVCLRYAGSKEDAQDILHEGFLKIFEKIGQFEGRGSFEGWVRKIMVNTALEKFRNQYKLIRIQDDIKEVDTSGSEDINENITASELLLMIRDLTPQYRMVFNLYAIEGYSHKEIAEKLNISEGTSKSNLSRARTILQEKVKHYYKQSLRVG
jgi:RNA polymerase sigma factor (sigma-70 family)